jgi:hypothetical protein
VEAALVDSKSETVLESYRVAVEAHFGARMAAQFSTAATTLKPTGDDVDEYAARLLEAAMLEPDATHPGELPLTSVELRLETATATLAPHEAHAHPLLSDWTQLTFALSMADAMRAGRLLTALAAGAPIFDLFQLFHGPEGEIYAWSQLSFQTAQGWATAKFNYGEAPPIAFARISIATGTAVFKVGSHVREVSVIAVAEGDPETGEPAPRRDGLGSAFGRDTLH